MRIQTFSETEFIRKIIFQEIEFIGNFNEKLFRDSECILTL